MPISPVPLPDDGLARCGWAGSDPLYRRYHDEEWGRPSADDTALFEKICLEGFQAGLSWITVLRKRERFRERFHRFEMERVAAMDGNDVESLLADPGIIRHRAKIVSTINNAARAIEMRDEFGSLAAYFWRFEPVPAPPPTTVPSETEASRALSKDLRRRGFTFVGPVTCYAFMQAMGLVDDHSGHCHCRPEIEALRTAFLRPV